MKYEERLIVELKNPDGNFWWDDTWPYSQLDATARNMLFLNNEVESKIASLLIFHQLVEEHILLLQKYCNLILRASLYPIKLTETESKKHRDFSKNLDILQGSIEFKNKSKLISACIKLNDLRNNIGHRIFENIQTIESNNNLYNAESLYDEIFSYRTDALRWCYEQIDRLKKKAELQIIINKY